MEASLCLALSYPTKCCANGGSDPSRHKLSKSSTLKVNGFVGQMPGVSSPAFTSAAALVEDLRGVRDRQMVPTEKLTSDPFRQGSLVEGGSGYRQTVVIRSYEVGPDKTATLETILNLLQTIPGQFLETHQLSSIILEYRKECGASDMVQSMCEPDEDPTPDDNHVGLLHGFCLASEILDSHSLSGYLNKWPTRYTHLLQIKGENKNEEIVRGRTTWRKNLPTT